MIRRLLSSLNFAVVVLALPFGLACLYAVVSPRPDTPQPVTSQVTWFVPVPIMDIPVTEAGAEQGQRHLFAGRLPGEQG